MEDRTFCTTSPRGAQNYYIPLPQRATPERVLKTLNSDPWRENLAHNIRDETTLIYYYRCEACHQFFQNLNNHRLCSDCYETYAACNLCGSFVEIDDLAEDSSGTSACPSCQDQHVICEECGTWAEDSPCEGCEEEHHRRHIHDYHDGASCGTHFHPLHESLYFGVELETENYEDLDTAAELLDALSDDNELFWLEEDCSLHRGCEIITQPCTLDFHRDQFPWEEIRTIVRQNGGSSEKTDAAALHIHFSSKFFEGKHMELYQLRLIYLFEKFWEQLVVLARTSPYLLDRSTKRYTDPLFDLSAKRKIRQLRGIYNRYQAVNLHSSQPTIEIRLFRGTLSRPVILASIELVDFLVRTAKNTSTKQLQWLTWESLTKRILNRSYQFLPAYLESKREELCKTNAPQEPSVSSTLVLEAYQPSEASEEHSPTNSCYTLETRREPHMEDNPYRR